MNIKKFLKYHWFSLIFAIVIDLLAYSWWHEFVMTGEITDSRHNLVFPGVSAAGHLVSVSVAAIYLNAHILIALAREITTSTS